MPRPVTLFTGQWADLPFETLCEKAANFGYDGLELACWGDHFDVVKAAESDDYCRGRWEILQKHGLTSFAISMHLVGQAVCDRIDERHRDILPDEVWGDGDPEGVRQRAAERMKLAGDACDRFFKHAPDLGDSGLPGRGDSARIINGFTGSSIWHSLYAWPPTSQDYWEAGFRDFAERFKPILDHYDRLNINFALEVHPTEIAFDTASTQRAVSAIDGHPRFGFNYDPSHLGYQAVDYVKFIRTFADRIFHCHMKDVWWGRGDGTAGTFGGHTSFIDPRRTWDFRSLGHGDIDFESIIVALNDISYTGPLSVEWEDGRMDREFGATEAAAFVRRIDFPTSDIVFDAQFDQ